LLDFISCARDAVCAAIFVEGIHLFRTAATANGVTMRLLLILFAISLLFFELGCQHASPYGSYTNGPEIDGVWVGRLRKTVAYGNGGAIEAGKLEITEGPRPTRAMVDHAHRLGAECGSPLLAGATPTFCYVLLPAEYEDGALVRVKGRMALTQVCDRRGGDIVHRQPGKSAPEIELVIVVETNPIPLTGENNRR